MTIYATRPTPMKNNPFYLGYYFPATSLKNDEVNQFLFGIRLVFILLIQASADRQNKKKIPDKRLHLLSGCYQDCENFQMSMSSNL